MTTGELVVDVSQDWILACDVQQRFMQGLERTSVSADLSARCRQVRAIGGDCYDFMPLADDRVALVVGDASGKGLAAALMIANVQASLRTAASFTGDDLSALLQAVNRQAYTSSLADRYATLFYGVFDGATRTLRYVNAGHNPPVVLRRDGSTDLLKPGGAPVGMFPDSKYEECVARLNPGDLVIACTDGVIEAANPAGEEWGVEGLLRATVAWAPGHDANADDLVRLIFNSMDDFTAGHQVDDATVAVLQVR
ncbi:MAG TPA: PP2C family protein-serine/threonine phosphatase [Candidatus Angelobacter sp.]|nr:PP2C family protein-serine/threonine phosphatase [Candidatus Angelobacter sp.]